MQDGLIKVINGDTSFEEILRLIDVDEDFGEEETEIKAAILGKIQENTSVKDVDISGNKNLQTLYLTGSNFETVNAKGCKK